MQDSLFSPLFMLSEHKQKKLLNSEEHTFYQLIFSKIQEEDFQCLYSEKDSRPNAPINAMVSSLILMHKQNWTYEQLFKEIDFNLLTRTALGLNDLDETPFCSASIFNFQNKVNQYAIKTGINLFEKVFDHLTREELTVLKIKTNIQRTDSFMAASNIRHYSRLQLLVELLIRIYRVLDDDDKQHTKNMFDEYTRNTSSQYLYHLRKSDIPHKIEAIGQLYYWIAVNLMQKYQDVDIFKTFAFVYEQHFSVENNKITIIPSDQLTSGSVQSPDDLDATYRKKSGKESQGQSVSITETAHPDNTLNLITDVAIAPNNTDDSTILNSRLDTIKEKTPDIHQLHFDGAYGSKDNDEKMEQLAITPIQTAVKGRKQRVPITIHKVNDTAYTVTCPTQSVSSLPSRQRHKACFDASLCAGCLHADQCPATMFNNQRIYYFTDADYLKKQRHANIDRLPHSLKNIRANVEATVGEFSHKMRKRKLKVRGFFKTAVFAYSTAIAVNFGRIYRLLANNGHPDNFSGLISSFFSGIAHAFSVSASYFQRSAAFLLYCQKKAFCFTFSGCS